MTGLSTFLRATSQRFGVILIPRLEHQLRMCIQLVILVVALFWPFRAWSSVCATWAFFVISGRLGKPVSAKGQKADV